MPIKKLIKGGVKMVKKYLCSKCDEIIYQSICPTCKDVANPIHKCKCGTLVHPNHSVCPKCGTGVKENNAK